MGRVKRSARNIAWIEKFCRAPEGEDVGKLIKVRPFQKKWMRKIYDNPAGTRLAIISVGKKNGKSSFAAFLLLLHLCGPEATRNSQLPSTAQSKEQAAVLYRLAAKIGRMDQTLSSVLIFRDGNKEIACPELGTLYRALSKESKTAHGQSPKFAVHDELGQVRGPISELYNSIENAMGAHENPMSLVISTQAPNDDDLLSKLIDNAKNKTNPRTVLILYEADEDINPFTDKALKQANPALGDFLNIKELRGLALAAKEMPSAEPEYRNYSLNQRVEREASFIPKSLWDECGAIPLKDIAGLPAYGGLDLSTVNDLTSFTLVAEIDGIWHVRQKFWLPEEGLKQKSDKDHLDYGAWVRQGYITLVPGPTISYEYVAHDIFKELQDLDIRKIAFDRYNFKFLKPWLEKAGFDDWQIEGDESLFEEFGQGYVSMSPALLDLEGAIIERRIAHGNNKVLALCNSHAVVTMDPAGNRKLDKAKARKASRRIDGMVTLTMAKAMAVTYSESGSLIPADYRMF